MKKVIAIGLLVSIGLCFLLGIFANVLDPQFHDALETLLGCAILLFGIWAAVLLLLKK